MFLGCRDAGLSFHSPGTLVLPCSHPPFKLLSSPAAIWQLADPRSRWRRRRRLRLPWLQLPELALGPSRSTLKWKEWPLSSMPSTTLAGRREEEGGVRQRNQRRRFQLWRKASLKTQEDGARAAAAGRREEKRGEEPWRPPEISAAAVTRSWDSG